MTEPNGRDDVALEGRVRTLLLERAEAITGPPPPLPMGVEDRADHVPSDRHRRRWVAAAVAVAAGLLLVGGLAVAIDQDPAPQELRTTQPADPTAGLPEGFDLDTAPAVFVVQDDASPTEVAERYLGRRLGSLDVRPEDTVADLELDAGTAEGGIVPVAWRPRSGGPGGTVLVRTGGRQAGVVAATTPGVDLGPVHYQGSVLQGQVRTADDAPTGPALVDVLPFGEPFATFRNGPPPADATVGYGSTAKGDGRFTVDTGEHDPIVTARFAKDGVVQAISEVAFHAPDDPTNDLTKMTDEERSEQLRTMPPTAPCAAASADLDPLLTHAFPGGDGSAARVASDVDVFRIPEAETPAAAVAKLGDLLGVPLDPVTSAAPFDGSVAVGARAGDLAVMVQVWPHDGVWSASEATTPAACWSVGSGNLTPIGAPEPRTRIELSTIAGARTGELWYRDADGRAWIVPLDADDFARGNVAVDGEFDTIKWTALVARDADGNVVLVQQTQG